MKVEAEDVSIGIVTTLAVEFAAVKIMLEAPTGLSLNSRQYVVGHIPAVSGGNHTVVLIMTTVGGASSAATVGALFKHFPNIRHVILCGIAAGVPSPGNPDSDVRPGDVVVSDGRGVISLKIEKEAQEAAVRRLTARPPSPELLDAAQRLSAGELEGKRPWESYLDRAKSLHHAQRPSDHVDSGGDSIDYPPDPDRRPALPRIFLGPIASVSEPIPDANIRDLLRDQYRVKALEMEGTGVAEATWETGRSGYLVVRGIVDNGDDRKGDLWHGYAAVAAAAFTRALLESVPAYEELEPVLTWLHLSDLQIGSRRSHRWDQSFVLDRLLADIEEMGGAIPRPDVILVTGDIAYTGSDQEYEKAREYLLKLAEATGLRRDRIFLVPGNHDVTRDVSFERRDITRLLAALRSGAEPVDEALSSATDREALEERFQAYLRFAAEPGNDLALYWTFEAELRGHKVCFVGFNTALLSESDDDYGKLHLGSAQLSDASARAADSEIVIVLSHHPFEWLADREVAYSWFREHADIHLSGHAHARDSGSFRVDSENRTLWIAAGIGLDFFPADAAEVRSYTYNFGAVFAGINGGLEVRVWPRRWSDRATAFRADIDNLPDGVDYARVYIGRHPVGSEVTIPGPIVPMVPSDVPGETRVRCLDLQNFRGFESQKVVFSRTFNVLLGDNGTGKTAILDALAKSLGAYVRAFFDFGPSYALEDSDVRRLTVRRAGKTYAEPQFPCSVTCAATFFGQQVSWVRRLEAGTGPHLDPGMLSRLVGDLRRLVQEGKDVVLPLVAYYGSGRLWSPIDGPVNLPKPGSKRDGYLRCLDPRSDQESFLQWFKAAEAALVQRKVAAPKGALRAVKTAVESCLSDWRDIYFDLEQDELVVTSPEGEVLPFRMLSDGIRNVLAMVADMAWRSAVLNPHLEAEASRETPGVVLVDELDLHLHPSWQRLIVLQLTTVFPRVQFITTTHSAIVAGTVEKAGLFVLERDQDHGQVRILKPAEDVFGQSTDQILMSRYFGLDTTRAPAAERELRKLSKKAMEGDDAAALRFLEVVARGLSD